MSGLWPLMYVWLASAAGATLLGQERGRWRSGLLCGLLLGPLGILVAGFMQPTAAVAARRAAAMQKILEDLRRVERLESRAQKRGRRDLDIRASGLAAQLFGDEAPKQGH